MLKTNLLKELIQKLSAALPEQVSTLKEDFEKNCRAIISQTFEKFDVVTREEFDIQNKLLVRTREKLERLEQQLQELEKKLQQHHAKK